MKLNKRKTRIISNGVARRRLRTGVVIDEQLEEVSECKNLGRLVTRRNEIGKEIAQRMASGWRRFEEYSHFLNDRKIPIYLKRKNHGYSHLTNHDLWSRDMDSNKTSGERSWRWPNEAWRDRC